MSHSQVINARYELQRELGRGGMGVVYAAFDRLTKQPVALKQVVLQPAALAFQSLSVYNDPHIALAREFQTLASLRHPHIVSVLDYGFHQVDAVVTPFFTMELLSDALDIKAFGAALSQTGKVQVLIQMLSALAYLHRRGILHRDLKPANVLVRPPSIATGDDKAIVKVMDFGLAATVNQMHTQADGLLSGTLAYLAPEVLQQHAAPSVQSDLFAFGLIAYEVFTGQHPFADDNLTVMLMGLMEREADVTVFDDPLAQWFGTMLAKSPTERPPDAFAALDAFCQAVGYAQPPEAQAVRESFLQASNFVGRDVELKQLKAALSAFKASSSDDVVGEAVDTRQAFYLVGGESGVGKTRLIDELRTLALVDGLQVLRGQAVDGGGLPFQAWRSVLRQAVLMVDFDHEADALTVSILKALVPDIDDLLGYAVTNPPAVVGQTQQNRLVFAIVDVFKRLPHRTLLMLEDLQWANESLMPLQQMLKVAEQLPNVLVVATYRSDERPDLPQILAGFDVMMLSRLSRETISELSSAMLGEAGQNPQLVDLLANETEGNTFFMLEVVRALAEEAGRLADIGSMTLPRQILTGGMQAVLRRRLQRVPQADQPLLQRAAVAGRQIDRQLLQHIMPDADIDGWLYRAEAAAVLTVQNNQWQFAHDKLREATLQNVSDAQRAHLHRDIATTIEAIYPDNADYNEALLDHWHEAGDVDKAMQYLQPVAQYLVEIAAGYHRAQTLLERGLANLGPDDSRRPVLMNWLAYSLMRQGEHAAAVDMLKAVQTLAQTHANQHEMAYSLYLLGNIMQEKSDYVQARDYYQQGLALFRQLDDQVHIARSLIQLGSTAQDQAQYAPAQDYFEQALALSIAIDDQRSMGICANNLGSLMNELGDYTASQAYFKQSLAISQAIGDLRGIASSYNNLGFITSQLGDREGCKHYLHKSLSIFQATGDINSLATAYNNLGALAAYDEDYDLSRDYLEQSLVLRRKLDDQNGISYGLTNLGLIAYRTQDYQRARILTEESLAIRRAIEEPQGVVLGLTNLSHIYLRLGYDAAPVRAMLHEGLTIALDLQAPPLVLSVLIAVVVLMFRHEDRVRAIELLGMVQAHPAYNTNIADWMTLWQPELEADLDPAAWQAALKRGESLDFDATVQAIGQALQAGA